METKEERSDFIMTMPIAYAPEHGYRYQILVRTPYDRAYEHCDYAKDKQEKKYLLTEYAMAYGTMCQLKTIELPRKYWS